MDHDSYTVMFRERQSESVGDRFILCEKFVSFLDGFSRNARAKIADVVFGVDLFVFVDFCFLKYDDWNLALSGPNVDEGPCFLCATSSAIEGGNFKITRDLKLECGWRMCEMLRWM